MKHDDQIIRLYDSGLSWADIQKRGFSLSLIAKALKGHKCRTAAEAGRLAWERGKFKLTPERRLQLSLLAQQSIKASKKFWTKPERLLFELLTEIGIGVRLPDYVKEICGIQGDDNGRICFQYPIQRYVCDFVCPDSQLVLRVQGDFWHANPALYAEDNLTAIQQHNIRQDKHAKIFLEKNGWIVQDVWESDIYWRRDKVIELCQQLLAGTTSSLVVEDWSDQLRALWFRERKPKKQLPDKKCLVCNGLFKPRKLKSVFCSQECSKVGRRKAKRPTKEELQSLLWRKPTSLIAVEFGVSDKTIAKWARQMGLTKPGPGYWAKQRIAP